MDSRRSNGHSQRQSQRTEHRAQRFSWQMPPSTPPQESTVFLSQQQSHQQASRHPQHSFSYAQTPTSPTTSIEPWLQPSWSTSNVQPPQYADSACKEPSQPPISQYVNSPSQIAILGLPMHPVDEPQRSLSRHTRQRSTLQPLNTNVGQLPPIPNTPQSAVQASPLPQKNLQSPSSPGPIPTKRDASNFSISQNNNPLSPSSQKSGPLEPYSPHGLPTLNSPSHVIFSPDAAMGPNGLNPDLHKPGQSTHPNMNLSANGTDHEWKHSLFECSGDVGTCLTGLLCPCILYGRTAYRLSAKTKKKDPTDMLGYSAMNGQCGLMVALSGCGLGWVPPLVHRSRLRHTYKLKGGIFGDIIRSCCCCCCAVIQNEREVRDREESKRRWAGPASTEVYTAPPQMAYRPQA